MCLNRYDESGDQTGRLVPSAVVPTDRLKGAHAPCVNGPSLWRDAASCSILPLFFFLSRACYRPLRMLIGRLIWRMDNGFGHLWIQYGRRVVIWVLFYTKKVSALRAGVFGVYIILHSEKKKLTL